jgi:hypothetical protein
MLDLSVWPRFVAPHSSRLRIAAGMSVVPHLHQLVWATLVGSANFISGESFVFGPGAGSSRRSSTRATFRGIAAGSGSRYVPRVIDTEGSRRLLRGGVVDEVVLPPFFAGPPKRRSRCRRCSSILGWSGRSPQIAWRPAHPRRSVTHTTAIRFSSSRPRWAAVIGIGEMYDAMRQFARLACRPEFASTRRSEVPVTAPNQQRSVTDACPI